MLIRRILAGALVSATWFLGLFYMPGWMLFAVLLAASSACQNEFYLMMRHGGFSLNRPLGLTSGALWLVGCYALPPLAAARLPFGNHWVCLALVALIFTTLTGILFNPRIARPIEYASVTLLGFFYIPFMLSFFVRLAQWGATACFEIPSARIGVFLAGYVALVVKVGDIGAFASGLTLGRHPLFPRVSPKKTWEGLAGGLAASMLASVVMIAVARQYRLGGPLATLDNGHASMLGLVLGGVGVLGDLVESLFKRATQIKDSGALFPGTGIGGILDMFDSLTFAPAFLYFYLLWFVGKTVGA